MARLYFFLVSSESPDHHLPYASWQLLQSHVLLLDSCCSCTSLLQLLTVAFLHLGHCFLLPVSAVYVRPVCGLFMAPTNALVSTLGTGFNLKQPEIRLRTWLWSSSLMLWPTTFILFRHIQMLLEVDPLGSVVGNFSKGKWPSVISSNQT